MRARQGVKTSCFLLVDFCSFLVIIVHIRTTSYGILKKELADIMEEKAQAILDRYTADVDRWRERGGQYKDIQPLTINDVLYIKAILHPTKRKESLKLTEDLVSSSVTRRLQQPKRYTRRSGSQITPY
jgi:hypothetical protein